MAEFSDYVARKRAEEANAQPVPESPEEADRRQRAAAVIGEMVTYVKESGVPALPVYSYSHTPTTVDRFKRGGVYIENKVILPSVQAYRGLGWLLQQSGEERYANYDQGYVLLDDATSYRASSTVFMLRRNPSYQYVKQVPAIYSTGLILRDPMTVFRELEGTFTSCLMRMVEFDDQFEYHRLRGTFRVQ